MKQTDQGVILDVHIKPNSKEFRLIIQYDELVVLCREAPIRGKVNSELLKQFSRLFGRKVVLVSGFTSKEKKILVRNIETDEANRILNSNADRL